MRSKHTPRDAAAPHRRRGKPGITRTRMFAPRLRGHEKPADGPPSRAVDTFFGGLAHRLGLPAGANLVFGERVEHDGVVVIPIAKATWGMGGGMNAVKDAGGGGGGATVRPFGYVQLSDGTARFHSIFSPLNVVAVIVAGTAGTALMLRSLARLLASFKSDSTSV